MSESKAEFSKPVLFLLLLVLLGGVGALDYFTGYELRLGVLYAMTVGFASWHFGLAIGIGAGVAVVGIEQWVEVAGGKIFSEAWIPYVNSVNRLVIYLFVAFSFSHFRKTIDRAHNQLKAFQGRLPVCSCCHKVGGGDGFWVDFPTYIRKNSEMQPEFKICPVCEREGKQPAHPAETAQAK